ncbi:serine/threonine-protein kinase Chk1 isoform X2 [Hydra vulgaris]|uniref:non-specific serine/threonine protein kinase n=1 Tax=Hydra vulgaris TaxID=6087 RepID=A0ABM4B651_HYDVU
MAGTVFEPFVEGWDFVETLGEGAYGEVRLAINRKTQEAVAVKIVNADKLAGNKDCLKKEVCIHKMLQHSHIIKFYGQRTEKDRVYLFLEYAAGGELFDRIEPDVGMPIPQACRYFKQLINGLEYIHSKGVTHRDIKPENILLDVDGNLKITDFGLSTVFRYKDVERLLERCCGTPPYVAPEVLQKKEYKAEPADIWSCGIVLTAMLAGELPWDEPIESCKEYLDWSHSKLIHTPWNKLNTTSIGFLKKLLHPVPSKRYTIAEIKKDKWFNGNYGSLKTKSPLNGLTNFETSSLKKHCSSDRSVSPSVNSKLVSNYSSSQPIPSCTSSDYELQEIREEQQGIWYSQPVNIEDMLLSQISLTPGSSQNPMAHLAKRMTRFNLSLTLDESVKKLSSTLKELSFQYKIVSLNQIRITSHDRRKHTLTYLTNLIEINQRPLLVDFRLSKGDGLEFKRQFKTIKGLLCQYVV